MAANDKKQTIVIKKITVVAAGGHGGSWKVAFADFMTAMMAFFLVMWLVNQSEEVKKSVADYFSTPSVIEYNFSNFGVELTLEKLFLDLVNEPLKAFEQFITPVDKKPDIMDMGMKKIQVHFLQDKIGEFADVQVTDDEVTFDIPEDYLFKPGTATPNGKFAEIMERMRGILEGLKDTDVFVTSEVPYKQPSQEAKSRNLAEARLDFVSHKVEQSIVSESVDIFERTSVQKVGNVEGKRDMRGMIKFRLRKKDKPKSTSASTQKAVKQVVVNKSVDNRDQTVQKEDIYNKFTDDLTKRAEGREPAQDDADQSE